MACSIVFNADPRNTGFSALRSAQRESRDHLRKTPEGGLQSIAPNRVAASRPTHDSKPRDLAEINE